LPGKLKVFSIILLVPGALGIAYGFMTTPSNTDDVKEIVAAQQAKTSELHQKHDEEIDQLHQSGFAKKAMDSYENDDYAKDETKLTKAVHQLRARPYAAVFVGAFFFFMIA